jgi:NAD(P)-dependent dehydrogenase (short-subunit alcohol dehydrogenase family)
VPTPTLSGKVLAIVGGCGRIGAKTSQRLAAEGAQVLIGDLDGTAAQTLAADIATTGGRAVGAAVDVADEQSVKAFVETVRSTFGRLDGLHVNAADTSAATIGRDRDIVSTPMDVFDRTMAVNLRGPVLCLRAAMPLLLAGGGAIVITSSASAFYGSPARAAYAMSKAGVNALVRHVARRWGPEGVRANAIAPGLIPGEDVGDVSVQILQSRETYLAKLSSPRLGRGEDVAGLAAFLLSDDAEWINGQVVHVNGGFVT